MSSEEIAQENVSIRVENIGGIDETELEVSPGVTALTGRNATNRTSFLRATMAALGSDRVSLKGDAEEGHVELTIDDSTYTRTLTRKNDTVTTSGEPYLDDPTVADLFAFLLESNGARRAAACGENLRDLIMRPIDTDAIRTDIEQRESERRRLDDELKNSTVSSVSYPTSKTNVTVSVHKSRTSVRNSKTKKLNSRQPIAMWTKLARKKRTRRQAQRAT